MRRADRQEESSRRLIFYAKAALRHYRKALQAFAGEPFCGIAKKLPQPKLGEFRL